MSSGSKGEGQVTLNQMLKVLDKDVAGVLERKLKRLSKKKAIKAPLDEHKAAQIERKINYSEVKEELNKWDAVVKKNRKAKQLNFPLDQEHDVLPSTSESVTQLEPRNEFEASVQNIVHNSETALRDKQELTKAEEKYLRAISAEEAKDRHLELQRMRVLLSSYAAKMRRQKAIKSKSYRRLLKKERVKAHMKKVESNGDALLDEIKKLERLRAQERASLKHKNTGKWAKHAKFRMKYDEDARRAMLDQIGIANKLLERPAMPDSDSDDEDDDEDLSDTSDDSEVDVDDTGKIKSTLRETQMGDKELSGKKQSYNSDIGGSDRLIISSDLISNRAAKRKTSLDDNDDDMSAEDDNNDDDDEENEKEQRQLMSEAFANDDVVKQFRKSKKDVIDEEQPKDIDQFLPGWGDWAGPGIKISKKKRKKHIIRAPKVQRKDETLGNVIISERANDDIKELQVKSLPRGIKDEKHLEKIMSEPVSATFSTPLRHREIVKPRVKTLMGTKIEPINKRVLRTNKAKWAE